MDPSKAAALAVGTLLGLFLLCQTEGARASAISLRTRREAPRDVRCASVQPAAAPASPLVADPGGSR